MPHFNQIGFKFLNSAFIPVSQLKAKNTEEREIRALVVFCIFNSVSYQNQRTSVLASTMKTEFCPYN